MNIRTHFIHVSVTDDSRQSLTDWIEEQFSELESHGSLEIELTCTTEAPRMPTHGPTFDCHMRLKASWLDNELFSKTTGPEFLGAAHDCAHHLRGQLVKLTKKKRVSRRQMRKSSGGEYATESAAAIDESNPDS